MDEMEREERTEPEVVYETVDAETYEVIEPAPTRLYFIGAMAALVAAAFLYFRGRRVWAVVLGPWVPLLLLLGILRKPIHYRTEGEVPGEGETPEEGWRSTIVIRPR